MTLEATDLSVLAYGNGFTLWHYRTTDNSVTGSNYFNDAAHLLRMGDVIIANVDTDGGASASTTLLSVSGIASGVVSVADLLA